ncbi:MAG: SUMF1/EgtB/PvdO family nonheme iron enzyme, partial [Deltaproteobacteria bacterium]
MLAALALATPLLLGTGPSASARRPRVDRVRVPAGSFVMGLDVGGEGDERPRHTVQLGAFAIDRLEVSREVYALCVAAGACSAPRAMAARFDDPRQPVVGVSWSDAQQYCAWTGGRLPTEEEWEKSARGTDERTYAWGNEPPTAERAVFDRDDSRGTPDPVGTHPTGRGPYGALDLTGNVWEWTES